MTELFRDRRTNALPRAEDYDVPLTRTTLTDANRRFRQSGVQAVVGKDTSAADRIVHKTIKERFNSRRKGFEDFPTVGSYLDWLNQQASDKLPAWQDQRAATRTPRLLAEESGVTYD